MNSVGKTKFYYDYSVMKWKLIANIIYCQMISRKLEHKIILPGLLLQFSSSDVTNVFCATTSQ